MNVLPDLAVIAVSMPALLVILVYLLTLHSSLFHWAK